MNFSPPATTRPPPADDAPAAGDDAPAAGDDAPATFAVPATVGLTGLSCAEFTDAEEAILVSALATTLLGVEEEDIGDTSCADARRRRLLDITDSVSISCSITYSASSASVAASSIDSELTAVVDSGLLADNLADGCECHGRRVGDRLGERRQRVCDHARHRRARARADTQADTQTDTSPGPGPGRRHVRGALNLL